MASRAEIPASLLSPDKEDCLLAISKAVLKLRSERNFSREKLAKALACGVDAINTASNEKNLLSFDSIALLCHHFPDEAAPIIAILTGGASQEPTVAERLDRIERDMAAVRKAVA